MSPVSCSECVKMFGHKNHLFKKIKELPLVILVILTDYKLYRDFFTRVCLEIFSIKHLFN